MTKKWIWNKNNEIWYKIKIGSHKSAEIILRSDLWNKYKAYSSLVTLVEYFLRSGLWITVG